MKVLHLPNNIASQIQLSVRALREVGIEARGMIAGANTIVSSDGLESCSGAFSNVSRYSPAWFRDRISATTRVLAAVNWCDVIHYHNGDSFALPGARDVAWARFMGKTRLITFWGSDIRVPELECEDNPYFSKVYPSLERLRAKSRTSSYNVQKFYVDRGFTCIVAGELMFQHIAPELRSSFHLVRCGIDAKNISPLYPDPTRKKVVVVHSPSDPVIKGTSAVLRAVEILRNRGLEFDFILVENMERQRALEVLRGSDIFLDQFVLGGHGVGAIEAMALGKPVVCYIKPTLVPQYPADLPIVNANQDDLPQVLQALISDAALRRDLGQRSRRYVEQYHDSIKMAQQLKSLYTKLMYGQKAQAEKPIL